MKKAKISINSQGTQTEDLQEILKFPRATQTEHSIHKNAAINTEEILTQEACTNTENTLSDAENMAESHEATAQRLSWRADSQERSSPFRAIFPAPASGSLLFPSLFSQSLLMGAVGGILSSIKR